MLLPSEGRILEERLPDGRSVLTRFATQYAVDHIAEPSGMFLTDSGRAVGIRHGIGPDVDRNCKREQRESCLTNVCLLQATERGGCWCRTRGIQTQDLLLKC